MWWSTDHRWMNVSLLATVFVETVEHVFIQVHAERAAPTIGPMNRAGTPTLRPTSTQTRRESQVIQHPTQRQLTLHVHEVDERSLVSGALGCYSGSEATATTFPRRLTRRLVARSLFLFHLGLLGRLLAGRRRLGSRFILQATPGIVLRVERLVALPQCIDQMQEFSHRVPDGDGLVVGMLGDDSAVQSPNGRVEANCRQSRHPQVAANADRCLVCS